MSVDIPAPPAPTGTSPTRGPGSKRWEDRHEIVGGYAYTDPIGYAPSGLSPASYTEGPVQFDPYRNGDMRRILQNQINAGTLIDLQDTLVASGLLAGDYIPGYLDDATTDAFSTLLGIANQAGADWRDILSQTLSGGGTLGGVDSGGELAPTVVTLPNRDDVKAALHETAMSLAGQDVDDDLVDAATESVLDTLRTQQERQFQQELAASPEGLTFTEGAAGSSEGSMNRLLEEEIRKRAPDQVMDKGVRDSMDAWFAALRGPVG